MQRVVWPRGKRPGETRGFAKRLNTLEGKTIGELWDWVYRGDEIFPMVEAELKKRIPGIKFIGYEVLGNTHSARDAETLAALPDKLSQNRCDGVISGIGC